MSPAGSNDIESSSKAEVVVCTLYEGSYEHGVAVLLNCLARSGFKGTVVAGTRKGQPAWCAGLPNESVARRPDASGYKLTDQIDLIVCNYDPKGHYTNCKPDWIELVFELCGADTVFYFDPDIVIEADWSFFERWVASGVALAEDVTPPMPEWHPKRTAWRGIYNSRGWNLRFKTPHYANGGFIGLRRADIEFVSLWRRASRIMSEMIGGLDVANVSGGTCGGLHFRYGAPFSKTDQDALNITIEAFEGRVVLLGSEAMGFAPGGHVMTHALGPLKPWNKPFIRQALKGLPPSRADLAHWNAAKSLPLSVSARVYFSARCRLLLARLIGRFYQKYI